MKTALVILAAGIGARYGKGIKQLEPVGPTGELIIDYSIHDAVEAGFNKIVFIIRRDIEADFREVIGNRIEAICQKLGVEVAYAYQDLRDLPEGFQAPEDRVKPWGTGHALLACREVLHEPFAVINADDYYGKEAMVQLYNFLQGYDESRAFEFALAGFILRNTLSDFGGVTRGVCQVDAKGFLEGVNETRNIMKLPQGPGAKQADGSFLPLDPDCYVSMNMWAMTPAFLQELEQGFRAFLGNPTLDPLKDEFLIPIFVDHLLKAGTVRVKVLPTQDKWFGVTYHEDQPAVAEAFRQLIAQGVYGQNLFEDLLSSAT